MLLLSNGILISAPPERSVSASRQFVLYGTNTSLRGAVSEVAEQTKANVLRLLQQRDTWNIPVIINLQFPQANLPELVGNGFRFSQTGSGLKLQLDLTIAADFDATAIRRQLVRVTLLEMMYRDSQQLPAGSFYVEPPDWLVEGLLAADPLQDSTAIVAALKGLPAEHGIPPLQEFLQQKMALLDSAGQLLYRGYGWAFVDLLLNEPNGPARLANYLMKLPRTSSNPIAELGQQFGIVGDRPETNELWKTSISRVIRHRYELLTPAETQLQLAALLGGGQPQATGSQSVDPKVFAVRRLSSAQTSKLRQLKQNLMLLSAQANPLLRPAIVEYEQVVDRILAHKPKGAAARLDRLTAMREQIRSRTTEMDDYMNWFEATKSGTASGSFTGYLRAAARSNVPPSRRRDPISVYLDALEEHF